MDIRPVKSEKRDIKLIYSGFQTTKYECLVHLRHQNSDVEEYGLQLIVLSNLSSQARKSFVIHQLSLSISQSWLTGHLDFEWSGLATNRSYWVGKWIQQYVQYSTWLQWIEFVPFQVQPYKTVYQSKWKSD